MRWFRQCDRRYPFLWETGDQPAARWHAQGDGPAQYLANTPEAAWAEFLRHEEITDVSDLEGVNRALWVVEDDAESLTAQTPELPAAMMTSGQETYDACQREARRLREAGHQALVAPSAAMIGSRTEGYSINVGFQPQVHDAEVLVLFGSRPTMVGWLAVVGAPPPEVVGRVHHLPRQV